MGDEADPGERERSLQRFYADKVFLLGDKGWRVWKNSSLTKDTVERMARWAAESSHGLFWKPPVPVGSFAEGLHLQEAEDCNGFDYLVPVRYNPKLALVSGRGGGGGAAGAARALERRLPTYIFREKGVPVLHRGNRLLVDLELLGEVYVDIYCEPQGPEEEEEEFIIPDRLDECQKSITQHNLDPVQILKDFHHCIEISLDPEKIRLEALDLEGPGIELAFDEGVETVPVKLVPAIQGVIKLSNQWIREDLTHLSDWWDGDLTNEKKNFLRKARALWELGPELVAKGGFWRLSFSRVEATLIEDVDADEGQRRPALRLLKFVNKTRWTPEYGKILTSYHLKTILLWCCEIYPQKAQWETLLSALQALLAILKHTLTKRRLPHYFLAPVNLFSRCYKSNNAIYRPLALEALCHEAEAMLADPVGYLMPDLELPDCVSPEYEEKMAALQEFKQKHQEELKELKRMEDEHMYEEAEISEEEDCVNPM
ncbi:Protein mab-21-like 3 [Varanus komodoensis]|nr:Protein mab-21-like 3 [Varanus komodoensis]